MTALADVVAFLDETLDTARVPDYGGAVNGLQVANRGKVTRIAAAVDFSTRAVNAAVAADANLLLVHHGMFWSGAQPITGIRYDRMRALLDHDLAVYSAHLPLDLHAEIGNNALLAKRLGLAPSGGFARFQQITVGLQGRSEVPTDHIAAAARALASEHGGFAVVTPIAPGRVTRRWGLCTGAGASSETLREAIAAGIDTLIVGEGPQHTAVEAMDNDIVIIYAGHYATETLGVRALAERTASHFDLTSAFLDLPTGL
jgi:dinuclear metal center YbgI/SA1388 family protein